MADRRRAADAARRAAGDARGGWPGLAEAALQAARSARAARSAARAARAAVHEAVSTLVPVDCPACGASAVGLCAACRAALRAELRPRAWRLDAPGGAVGAVAACDYTGVVRALLSAVKERGRLDAVDPLGRLLRVALAGAAAASVRRGAPVLVPAPSRAAATRARGFAPVEAITVAAAPGAVVVPALAVRRGTRDQAGLDRGERAANLAGAMRPRAPLRGARVLLVDDIVTTGATVSEAVRALRGAGATVLGVAVVAHTARRLNGACPPVNRPRNGGWPKPYDEGV